MLIGNFRFLHHPSRPNAPRLKGYHVTLICSIVPTKRNFTVAASQSRLEFLSAMARTPAVPTSGNGFEITG